jgi:RNA polymerase sigma-70 factor (ECF subfamily)
MTAIAPDALFAAARAGDQQAWSRIVDRYRPAVIRAARDVGLSAADAEDIAQETWLRLWQREGTIDPRRARAWLCTVARHLAISYRRKHGRVCLPGDDAALAGLAGAGADPAVTVADADAARAALAALPRRQRQVLISRAWLGSVPAAAAALGLQPGSVKSATSAGRAALRSGHGR